MKRELSIALFNESFDDLDFLKKYFKNVYVAKTLSDFLKILDFQMVDVALVDSIDVTKQIKRFDSKIIALTTKDDIDGFLNLNLKYILLKPINEQFYANFERFITTIQKEIKSYDMNRKLSVAIKQSVNIVIITDKAGIVEYVNPIFSKITEYETNEIVGKNVNILKSGKHSEKFYGEIWKTLQAGKVWNGEFINKKKSGKFYYEKAIISPVFDSKNHIVNFIAIKEDITKYKILKNTLDEKERLLLAQSKQAVMGEIISIIAHHWRQPIAVISSILNKIVIGVSLGNDSIEEIMSNINTANRHIKNLSEIIDDFKNYFRHSKEPTQINVENIIEKALHILKYNFDEENISVVKNFNPTGDIFTLESELTQVILNILINAKETFAQREIKNREIKILIYEMERYLIIEIIDNAGGFNEDDKYTMFEPYFSKKDKLNSTGLGLYIASMIMRNHIGGDIWAKNVKDGASFSISIPMSCKIN